MTETSSMQPRDAKKARNSLKQFADMMKGLMQLDENLQAYDDLDVAVLDKQKALDELTTKEAGLSAKIADVDAACAATVAEAESRKDAIESEIDAASSKLSAVEEQIATAKADLDAAIANRSSDIAQATDEAQQRLTQLTRDIESAEDRLMLTQTSLKKLREHLAAQ